MPRMGIVGPSYTSQSPNASDELCMNWYVESMEGNDAVSPAVLYGTPGLELFVDLTDTPIRGEITVNDRFFAVAGSRFYEISSSGTPTLRGTVLNDNNLVSMAGGTNQILIASFGQPYVFNLDTNTFTMLPGGTLLGPVSFVGYCDGFFVALLANSNQFQISELLDATVWDPLDTAKVSVFTGNVLSMIVDHREIWFYGERQTQVYYDSGNVFPFDVVQSGFIEAGIFAPKTPVRLDNTLLWLGGDERGAGVVWRASGYTPQRVSNHAVEFALQGYLTKYGSSGLSDAIGYSYQDQGHAFYVLYFPTANATWVYDVATGLWHQRGYWNAASGIFTAHRSQCHQFAFGKHLVGDWGSGKIYNMNISVYTDNGNPIRRVRRATHVATEQKWMYHSQLQVYLESGLGPIPPLSGTSSLPGGIILEDSGSGLWIVRITDAGLLQTTSISSGTPETLFLNDVTTPSTSWQVGVTTGGLLTTTSVTYNASYPLLVPLATLSFTLESSIQVSAGLLQTDTPVGVARDPMINLRWSNDGGHTWSNEYSVGAGQSGQYAKRVLWRRLGRARDRLYEVSASDPIPWRLVDAYLDISPGSGN